MKVIFQRGWISPEGQRFRHVPNVAVEVDDAFVKVLPKDAVIVEGAPSDETLVTTADVEVEPVTLASQDVARQDLDAEIKRLEALEANQPTKRGKHK